MKHLQTEKAITALLQKQTNFLLHLYELIEENMDASPLNVNFLATHMAVSRSTLNRKLSTLTGKSAHELIKNCRLKKQKSFSIPEGMCLKLRT